MKRQFFPTLALTAVLVGSLAACGEDEPDTAEDPSPAAETSASESETGTTETESTATEEPTETGTTEETVAVAPYFVVDAPNGKPALVQELREVPADNPQDEVAGLLAAGDTLDPDYQTLLPGDNIAAITDSENGYVVELADDSWNTPAPGQSKAEARLALQQLVYTLKGIDETKVPVRFTVGDGPVETVFGVPIPEDGLKPAPEQQVMHLVNVTAPAEGATVSDTFRAEGTANSFEATVPWEVRDASGKAVVKGFATAEGWMDRNYPWQSEVDVSKLEPGEYTFVAMTDDPSGGAEGFGPSEDTKTIVVE